MEMIFKENKNKNIIPELSLGSIKKIHGKSNSKRINVLHQTVEQLKRSLHRQRITKTFLKFSPKNAKQFNPNILLKSSTEKRNVIFYTQINLLKIIKYKVKMYTALFIFGRRYSISLEQTNNNNTVIQEFNT